MRTIKLSEYQLEKKLFISRKAQRLSKLSAKDKISKRPIDAEQAIMLRKADKARSLRWQQEGKLVWIAPRKVIFKI